MWRPFQWQTCSSKLLRYFFCTSDRHESTQGLLCFFPLSSLPFHICDFFRLLILYSGTICCSFFSHFQKYPSSDSRYLNLISIRPFLNVSKIRKLVFKKVDITSFFVHRRFSVCSFIGPLGNSAIVSRTKGFLVMRKIINRLFVS